ncbi:MULTISPECIES: hypothetical protein [unclassified Agarivorans]|uniref:hypothetical protein n=1 Tax=unclassified Agarivorans TaxID=2636026 RepID=UPI003D7E2BED
MNNLFTYVSIITNSLENQLIVERNIVNELVEDDGVVTQYSEQIVKFRNGVTIKQSIEKDVESSNTEVACEESFINYEVLFEPEDYDINPKRKNFINHCQEAFWVKISTVQNAKT